VAGADVAAHRAAGRSGADAIILELEDFTPPELRPKARAHAAEVLDEWRTAGALAGVRINPLETCGRDDQLAYVRSRFLVECRAAGVEAIDCPYTFSDVEGAAADARYARRLGYRMKSLVHPSHVAAVNRALTPNLARARRIVAAFEKARAQGKDRARLDGALIEVPAYAAAKRLLESDGQS
jgi:citrate lyase beta subunit